MVWGELPVPIFFLLFNSPDFSLIHLSPVFVFAISHVLADFLERRSGHRTRTPSFADKIRKRPATAHVSLIGKNGVATRDA